MATLQTMTSSAMVRHLNATEVKVLQRELEADKARKDDANNAVIDSASDQTTANLIDDFVAQCDDPNYFRTIVDKVTGRKVVLSDTDIDTINRIRKAVYPDPNYDPYEPYIDFFTYQVSVHPVMNRQEPKAAFIPSLSEKRALTKLVALITSGKLKPYKAKPKQRNPYVFNADLWAVEGDINHRRHRAHIAAPKMALPGHAESYNPPPEYLLTKHDVTKWESQTEEERDQFYLPQRFSNLRSVPFYNNIVRERFDRCLELYMCPRQRRRRANVDPEDLIPKLPRPKDLNPFPSAEAIVYRGHYDIVRSIAIEPNGQFAVSGSDDGTVKVWEIINGRCWQTITFDGPVTLVSWCPNSKVSVIMVSVGKRVYMLNSLVGDSGIVEDTDEMFKLVGEKPNKPEDDKDSECEQHEDFSESDYGDQDDVVGESEQQETSRKPAKKGVKNNKQPVNWIDISMKDDKILWENGCRLKLELPSEVEQTNWHNRGDYFAIVMPTARTNSVIISHLGRKQSQYPFKRGKHLFQRAAFHPSKPYLFAADDRTVIIYDLSKKLIIKKLITGLKSTSCISIHPSGDHLLVGSFEPRLVWFDTDLSVKPYKTMRYHKGAIRAATYHRKYPLFASGSDDSHVIVSHGMVYDDLTENALIVPLKTLHGHEHSDTLAVTDCQFHYNLPWLFSCGSDKTIRLFA